MTRTLLCSLWASAFIAVGCSRGARDEGSPDARPVLDLTPSCPPRPACDGEGPPVGAATAWRHTRSRLTASTGARHRGRDLLVRFGQPAWALAKFGYGPADDDISGEDVDVWIQRGCTGPWTRVGTYRTTKDGEHPTVLDVVDTGGRVFANLSATSTTALAVGRHRVHLSVAADRSSTDLYLEVLAPDTQLVITDVDGTLTSSEWAAVSDVAGLAPPAAHAGAAELLTRFVDRGYAVMYLTARPEWMTPVSREWLELRGFPAGTLHTTLSKVGAVGGPAAAYKQKELQSLARELALVPSWAFGNKESDAVAYAAAQIPSQRSYYFGLDPAQARGGQVHRDYRQLIGVVGSSTMSMSCR